MPTITEFLPQLSQTNFKLEDYTDFTKVRKNTSEIEVKLNTLNYLLGKTNLDEAIEFLYNDNPKVFSVLEILLAVRSKDKKVVRNDDGSFTRLTEYTKSLEGVKKFIHETGLADVFINKNVKNLVDYVFGVEVGLDTNARKNRSGKIMAGIVASRFEEADIPYRAEVNCTEFPELTEGFGEDLKRFDFVITTSVKTYVIETNFYSGGGSKLNEVARSYSEISPLVNQHEGYEFIWITDGVGWKQAHTKLSQALSIIPSVYNLQTLSIFIDKIKSEL